MFFSPRMRVVTFMIAAAAVLAPHAQAQFPLADAFWQESISLEVQTTGNFSTNFVGSDIYLPEPAMEELTGSGYNVSGSVQFGAEAPPVGITEVTWDLTQSASLDLISSVDISFQVRVMETSEPPVAVTEVPVHLVATGSTMVQEMFGPRATSFFRFQAIGTEVVIQENLDLYGDEESSGTNTDSFSIDQTPSIPPGVVVLVSMSATASMGTVSTGGASSGTAMGMIDPIIEIADEIIPGTSSSYRDYFAMEFSEGYDAQTTPVQRITFGDIKRRFVDKP